MISVIIPVYNMENYLHVCLNSVLKQTYQDFEIICIDDGSTDSSLEILEYFSQKDSRVKILKNNVNKGSNFSRNRGLDVSQGEYVYFLNGENWLSLDAFEILIHKSKENNLDLLMFNNVTYSEETHDFTMEDIFGIEFLSKFENKIFNHFDLDKQELFVLCNRISNNFYLKSFLDKNNIRFPNENCSLGYKSFFYKAMTSTGRISILDDYLYNKRKKSYSSIKSSYWRNDVLNSCYLILEAFLDNFQIYQYYKKDLLSYIFKDVLNNSYEKINKKFKDKFFIGIQTVYKNFIKDYDVYDDVLDCVDKDILDKFKFMELADEIFNYSPLISIIVPVYNSEEFLNKCLNSIITQTMDDIEVICINDGSSDSSLNILNYFRNVDYRVNIFSQENKGVALARNKGIEKANGEYVLFVDSDDWIEHTMCEELYSHAKHLNSDLVLFNASEINLENEFKERVYFPDDSFDEDYEEFTFDYKFNKKLVLNYYLVVWSKMYKKELVKNIKFPNVPLFEDNQFHVESMLLANKISYFPKFLYHYRKLNINSEQNSKVKSDKSLCVVDVFNGIYEFLTKEKYFEEFKINFLIFTLTESKNTLNKIDDNYKLELMEKLKIFYNSLEIDLNLINEISSELLDLYYNIINLNKY